MSLLNQLVGDVPDLISPRRFVEFMEKNKKSVKVTVPLFYKICPVADMNVCDYDKCVEYNSGDSGKMQSYVRALWSIKWNQPVCEFDDTWPKHTTKLNNPYYENTIITPDNSWAVMAFNPDNKDEMVGWGLLVPHHINISSSITVPDKLYPFNLNGEGHLYVRRKFRNQGYGTQIWKHITEINMQCYGEKPLCNVWSNTSQRFFESQGIDSYLWL